MVVKTYVLVHMFIYHIQLIEKAEAELAELKQQLSDIKKGFEEHVNYSIIARNDINSSLANVGRRVEGDKENIGHSQ